MNGKAIKMSDLLTRSSPQDVAEDEAALAEILAEMQLIREQMKADDADIERLKAETRTLKQETDALRVETRALLSSLKVLTKPC